MEEVEVVVVGAGPSGLAVAASLNLRSVPNLVLEGDDCSAPLWKKHSHDCLNLHLDKSLCQLPHLPHPTSAPTYLPKPYFVRYLDAYAARFGISPRFRRHVTSASYDPALGRWRVVARKAHTGEEERYAARYLVVATGANCEGVVPEVAGVETFPGEVMHSSEYRSAKGRGYRGKDVLVVGGGNSGMEIALDLCSSGARTSLAVRGTLHVIPREIWHLGRVLLRFLPCSLVDYLVLFLCYLIYGDLSKYGLRRPAKGPFYLKTNTPVFPVLDVGAVKKIKSGEIPVLPSITSIRGNDVIFIDGKQHQFDAIIFATGYRSTVKNWLKDDDDLIGDDGMSKTRYPHNWKGRNGLYCAGLGRRGLPGSGEDAENIAKDIKASINASKINGLLDGNPVI